MAPALPLLALRIGEQRHALEPGRTYLLGSSDECDLRVQGTEPQHAQLEITDAGAQLKDLSGEAGLLVNEERATSAELKAGDRIALAGELIVVIQDDGEATMVPLPELRRAANDRRKAQIRVAAAALRYREESFADQMGREMRRAPWLALSLVLHLIALLLLVTLMPPQKRGGQKLARHGFDMSASAQIQDTTPEAPEVAAEAPAETELQEVEFAEPSVPEPQLSGLKPTFEVLRDNPVLAPRKRPSLLGGGRGGAAPDDGDKGSGNFADRVAELQSSGLDIVFVFDSTGSMTRTIEDTKSSIVEMLEVLRSLVPGARVGLVTYRDRSRREEYLVRHVPLDLDYWRATNFVQFIGAEGGGDRPEDVMAGIQQAFSQKWRPQARRVVVLAGDAPTHNSDLRRLLLMVRSFTKNRRSFVHTLVTNPDRAGDDTREQFARIAKAGRGVCEQLENHQKVLQRVLTLAFGNEFDQDIESVLATARKQRDRVDVRSLHIARQGGEELTKAMRQRPVPTQLWNAVVRRPRRPVAEALVKMLGDPQTPEHTRHASAAALQRILELPEPPIDLEGGTPSRGRLLRLRRLAEALPN
ncbi:MAG: VWA domain-containing protein [Planctomycetota bacterium]